MDDKGFEKLPGCAVAYIDALIKKMGYRRKIRAEVKAELIDHFTDALKSCTDDRQQRAEDIISEFGDVKMLGRLIRRGKKRCRSLWRTMIVRCFQLIGVLLLCVVLRVGHLSIGRANISVDYVQWLNELVRNGKENSLNAMPYYNKAAELFDKELPELLKDYSDERGWIEKASDEQRSEIVKYLEENAEAFDLVREGAQKPYCWTEYKGETTSEVRYDLPQDVMESVLPQLSKYKGLAQKFTFISIAQKKYAGDYEGALSDCIVLHKFARHMQGKGLIIEQLVGIAIEAMGHYNIFEILEKYDVDTDVLENIQNEFEKNSAKRQVGINLNAEKAFWYDLVQRGFTDDGMGSGRVLKRGLPLAVGEGKEGLKGFVFGFSDRREIVAEIERYFEKVDELSRKTPWQLRQEGIDDEQLVNNVKSFLLKISVPANYHIHALGWRCEPSRLAIAAILAMLRYEGKRGAYPENLEVLVDAGFLEDVPIDPFSGEPLVYRKTEDGFILYSFGTNFTDDGGQYGINKRDGKRRTWGDEGDAVFWPVP